MHIIFNLELTISEKKGKEKDEEDKHQMMTKLIQTEDQVTSSYHLIAYHHLSQIYSVLIYI
jgi:hypothetical protein